MKQLLVFFSLITLGCKAQHPSGNSLPAQRPADFSLNYHVDGGMRYYSLSFTISADSCVYDLIDEGKKTHRVFKMDAGALDKLYQFLRSNRFDEITYTTEKNVYDRGGISIISRWNKGTQVIGVDDSGLSFVDKKWEPQWSKIENYVGALTRDQ